MPSEIFEKLYLLLIPFLTSTALTLAIEKFCIRTGLMDRPGERKMQTQPVPRMGGLAIFATASIFALALSLPSPIVQSLGALIVFLGGMFDDVNENNSVAGKLIFQIPGGILFAAGCDLSMLAWGNGSLVIIRILIFAFVFFMTNAANLMDNMNGLAGGLCLLITATLSLITALILREPPFALLGLLICASILGFSVRNFPLGKIYMGDQGSQFLGFFCSSYAVLILLKFVSRGTSQIVPQMGLLLGALFFLFFLDVFSVVCIRLAEGRSPFVGDQCHLSHQLLRRGFSPTAAVLILFAVQTFISSLVLRLL